jgi:zinc transport system substrate-binding protein
MAVEVEGKEPKPQDLNQLVKVAKAHQIHVIFVQPQFSKRSAESLASELNAVVVSTDPLAYNFDINLKAFAAALLNAAAK